MRDDKVKVIVQELDNQALYTSTMGSALVLASKQAIG